MSPYGKSADNALNLTVRYDAIGNLVLLVPVAYSFCGLRVGDHSSCWTEEGSGDFLRIASMQLKNGDTTERNERAYRDSAREIKDLLHERHPGFIEV